MQFESKSQILCTDTEQIYFKTRRSQSWQDCAAGKGTVKVMHVTSCRKEICNWHEYFYTISLKICLSIHVLILRGNLEICGFFPLSCNSASIKIISMVMCFKSIYLTRLINNYYIQLGRH